MSVHPPSLFVRDRRGFKYYKYCQKIAPGLTARCFSKHNTSSKVFKKML